MKRILLTAITAMALVSTTWADDGVQLTVRVNQPGAKINKEKSIEAFDKWISKADKHIYSISPMNQVAVSFSCGIAYKSDTVGSNSTAKNMIDRAENLLSVSVNKGGNKISIQK